MKSVTVCILTHNSYIYITKTLTSLLNQSYNDIEIIVIDNASNDNTVDIVKGFTSNINIVINKINIGFCAAYNKMIHDTKGDLFLPLNPDIILTDDYILEMVKAMELDSSIGMVQGKILQIKGDQKTQIIDTVGEGFPRNLRIRMTGYGELDIGQYDVAGFIFGPSGPAPMYRREMLEDIKINNEYYDTDFFMYREEADLAWRAQIMGWKCYYTPYAVAYHVRTYAPDTRKRMPRWARQLQIRNRWLMIIKNIFIQDMLRIRMIPYLVLYESLLFLYIIFVEPHLVRSIISFLRCLPNALTKRSLIISKKKVKDDYFFKLAGRLREFYSDFSERRGIKILGVYIDSNLTLEVLLRTVKEAILSNNKKTIMYVNSHVINTAMKMDSLRSFLNTADIVYCDGFGVMYAARLFKKDIKERMTGADWIYRLCEMCRQEGFSIYFLGGVHGVAEKAKEILINRYDGLKIVGTHHGYFAKEGMETLEVINDINNKMPDILLVGFGSPLQELWIKENMHKIDVNIIWAVGAMMDYVTGRLRRGPKWMTDYGFEWLCRLLNEPSRMWRRYLIGNIIFLFNVIKQWVNEKFFS